jgi:hypothetical protein
MIAKEIVNKAAKKIILISGLLLASACSTMHFTQNNSEHTEVLSLISSKWHNTTLNGMVEISYPVNLYQDCSGQPWHKVTVELGVKEGMTSILADTIVDAIIPGLSFVNLYTPWSVEVQCTKPLINHPSIPE